MNYHNYCKCIDCQHYRLIRVNLEYVNTIKANLLVAEVGGLTSGSSLTDDPGSSFGSFLIGIVSIGSCFIPGSVLIVSTGSVFITGSNFTCILFVEVWLEDCCCKSLIVGGFGKFWLGSCEANWVATCWWNILN